jgi:cobalt-zinc-cadmium efflux system membrane fusion protein
MKRGWTVFLSVALAAGFLLIGCSRKREATPEEKVPPDIVRIAPVAIRQIGMTFATVENRSVSARILTTAEIKADEERVFHVNPFVIGRVVRDNVRLGGSIRRGQVLAVVQNLEVARIQADYVHQSHQNDVDVKEARIRATLADQNLEREKRLLAEGLTPRKDYQQAQAAAGLAGADLAGKREHGIHLKAEAQALLSVYGARPGRSGSERIETGSVLMAPGSGIVTRKYITVGDVVSADTVMYEIADLSRVWLDIDIYPKDLSSVTIGQAVRFTSDSAPNKTFLGRINYIQPTAAETSRTYVARAYIDNAAGLLRPGMFGQAGLERPAGQTKPFIPEDAVQKYGRDTFVFIPMGGGRFRKRTVRLGETVEGGYLADAGVWAGDRVVLKGSFTLKAEMFKSLFAEEE